MVYRLFVLVYRCNENIECLEKCISYAKLQSISNYWCSFQIDPIKERLKKLLENIKQGPAKTVSNKHLSNSVYKPHLYC